MPKFFLSPEEIGESFITLSGEQFRHAKVLRLRQGEQVTVSDGTGNDYLCTVSDVSEGLISLVVNAKEQSRNEPRVACRIYMAYAKSDKLEHVIMKATELGAAEIIAFPSARCVVKPDEKTLAKKLERWRTIAVNAAQQSGRGAVPEIRTLPTWKAMLADAAACDLPVLFYENEEHLTYRQAIEEKPFSTAAIVTGPEGGFEFSEVQQAQDAGFKICTLGTRILRCETAPLCALSALMYAAGEF